MDADRNWDRKFLADIKNDDLTELLFMHIRNIWSEDGLYFLGIEKRFGLDAAIEIDSEVWAVMGSIEARRLKRILGITKCRIPQLFSALKHSTWWLNLEYKGYELEENRLVIRNKRCHVQITREKKGLGEFGCKPVRTGFLNSFVKEFNPDIKVVCNVCPPDEHPKDLFCEWEFSIND